MMPMEMVKEMDEKHGSSILDMGCYAISING